jgi:hypothetical protein
MIKRGLMPLIMESGAKALGQPDLTIDAPEQEGTTVRRQGPTLKIGPDRLSTDRRKTQLRWARIGHNPHSAPFSAFLKPF